jgi:hypothetical protein
MHVLVGVMMDILEIRSFYVNNALLTAKLVME